MSSVGRICVYCARPIAVDDRVAVCDRCWAAHHEACWDRNGRCSTFRCTGMPRTMRGDDLPALLQSALLKANEQPESCPYCAGDAYAGLVQGRRKDQKVPLGLLFVQESESAKRGLFGRRRKSWWLPGAHLKARSCVRCKRLFLWGVPVDDLFLKKAQERAGERFCPHCAEPLTAGELSLDPSQPGGARFECDETPVLHKDWLSHTILDRFFHSRWNLPVTALPALSCESCQYTEAAGRPIYRFL